MSAELHLRPYQTEAINAVFTAWSEGMMRPAVVLPTGMGKTVVFSHLAKQFIEKNSQRVVVLVHRDELADQAIDKIRSVAPHLNVGKVKAESDEITADVMVCSVQTLAVPSRFERLRAAQGKHGRIGLVIVDECHHAAAQTYQSILTDFGCFGSGARAIGFTATMARGDSVGLGDTWQDVVYTRSVLYAISKGFLTDVKGHAVSVGVNLSAVKTTGGDFQSGDLGRALEESDMESMLPVAYREHAGSRSGVVFTPTVATAQSVAQSFNAAGIRTAVISGETPRDERQKIYADYRTGRVQVLSNCMVLTEGFDAPWASCAVIARPTQSKPLYIQMVGRVLRPWPGKKDALVLDVVGVGGKLSSLIDLAPGQVEKIEEGESLEEAVLREETETVSGSTSGLVRDIKLKALDMFEGSSQSWLVTDAGVMFIPVGDGEVFLWPSDGGLWDVCIAPKRGPWEKLHRGMPIGTATAWAETEAEERMPFNTAKDASWRKRKPSDAQKNFAQNLGLGVTEDTRSGELGNAISVKLASRKFDIYARKQR